MSGVPLRVSATTTAILHEAYYKIASFGPDHYAVYDYVRATLSKITHVDSFYVGLLHGAHRVRFPYGFEGARFDDPEMHSFGPNGQTAWLLAHRQTYRYAYDNGAVLNASISFGDVRRASADAVTVPLLRPSADGSGAIFGMISMHSYRPGTYTDESVRAAEWLAAVVARLLSRQDDDRGFLAQLDIADGAGPDALTSDRVLEYLNDQFSDIRRAIAAILAEPADPVARLREVEHRCERIQTELIGMTATTDQAPERRFQHLTPAEQALAVLLTSGLSNADLARELGISANTVKTHLKNILRKYGMTDRTQIAADVRRHLGSSPAG